MQNWGNDWESDIAESWDASIGKQELKNTKRPLDLTLNLNFSCLTDFLQTLLYLPTEAVHKGKADGLWRPWIFFKIINNKKHKKYLKYIQMNTLFQTIRGKFDITYLASYALFCKHVIFLHLSCSFFSGL